MNKEYYIIVKTGDAELRAMRNLSNSILNKITPVIELTRGRAKKVGKGNDAHYIYPYEKKIEHIRNIFRGKDIVLDVTSDETLSSKEIDLLFDYSEGYVNWTNKVIELNASGEFNSIVPSILMNYDDDNFDENIKTQICTLMHTFHKLMYRCAIDNNAVLDDIELIKRSISNDVELLIIIDCAYVPSASYKNIVRFCIPYISKIEDILKGYKYEIVLCSTTFPNNVGEIGNDITDTFDLREVDIFQDVSKAHPNIIYGDYGSMNPIRNDQIVMARGWIPRIDVPLENQVYYYRKRRPGKTSAYSATYNEVARNAVADARFPIELKDDYWGFKQIFDCSKGDAPSASPSFWISVRMNSHIVQQVKRMKL